ncbi:peptidoglycan editing factor PgeF [Shewanella litorisediminis]|uniref:Purine nucleoside phosphorylase n=1 Tax=Shewanella litorisediminis TaxID=1173586 RepID=A0ABX7G0M9_9GAMM|nr:peptidoglycan editing factor PgeF [Shewanella litorisediminis]MCL2919845.1 peptidoglycan editing factor PgeF [Shewanella litorisediminis]QRH00885.1 peptidoglycan editing factor PgeF [Shewanella litorisediminis]
MLRPHWPLPPGVKLAFTDREGGVSEPPYDGLNLGLHVGDDAGRVELNRRELVAALALPCEPLWLEQVHGTEVYLAVDGNQVVEDDDILDVGTCGNKPPVADASYTNRSGTVCAVMTADCLPVLFASADGQEVAAAHAGWRGLCEGVLEQTLACFSVPPAQIHAYLGPAIGPNAFEVGAEVRTAFLAKDPGAHVCFHASVEGKFLADLFSLAKRRLMHAGVVQCFSTDICTFSHPNDYFSYRRDGVTGRMASLIWRD